MKKFVLASVITIGILISTSLLSMKSRAEEWSFEDNEVEEICCLEIEEEAYLYQDNDALFEEYALHKFELDESDIILQYSSVCRNNLNDYEKNIYDIIETSAKEIADGDRTSSIIEITYADIYGTDKITFYVEELETYSGNNLRTQLAYRIMDEVDTGVVIKALLDDCPYEFYWFDKLVGTVANKMTLSASISTDGKSVTINPEAPLFTLKYAVEESYATDTYMADISKTSAVSRAVNNARAVVSEATSKSDYDKVVYYANAIADLVSYDTSAVYNAGMGTQTDCDPWQLVYVFDKDSTTNVVCEGYAKAFQYLCDQSRFNGNVYSYIITGYAGEASRVITSSAYAHMWNFVHMDDERIYYMDVTWYDECYEEDVLIQPADVTTDSYFEKTIDGVRARYLYSNDTLKVYTSNQLRLSLVAYGEEEPAPTPMPSIAPTSSPTPKPSATPTVSPSESPTVRPTDSPVPETGETLKLINGTWYYYKNGRSDTSYTGLVQYNRTWYYVQKGVLIWNHTGLVQYRGVWYYVQNSTLKWGYNGLVQYNGIWYYVQNSTLKWGYNTLVQYNGTWYYVQNSTLKWGYNGLVQYNGTWYYVQNSTLKWGYNTLVQYNGTWYYVQNSTLKWGYNTLVQYNGTWYYVQNSTLKWGVNTLVQHSVDKQWYYVHNSSIDFSYNGNFTYNGKQYRVVNGKVVF